MAPLLASLLGAALISSTFASPAPAAKKPASRFTYYNLTTPLAAPCDLNTVDNEIYASTFLSNKLIYIDRTAAHPTLKEINIPYTNSPLPLSALPKNLQGAGACVVQPGGDGNVYYATGIRNQLVQYNPKTGKFKFFSNTGVLGNLQPFNDAWPGAGGMWFTQTTANVLSFFNYTSEKITSYEVPTPASSPVGVIVVGDNVWICEFLGQKIAKFNVNTKKFTEYLTGPLLLGPAVVRAYTQNKYIWFTAIGSNAIGRVNVKNGAITAFPNTANLGFPIEDTNDGKGNVWFSTAASNTLNYLIPKSGKIVEIAQPDGGITSLPASLPPVADIAMHWVSQDNSMWFTELAGNRIGRYQLEGNQ